MMPRYIISAGLSVIVTFGLFYLMRTLIYMEGSGPLDDRKHGVIDFVRLKRDTDVDTKRRKMPDKRPPPEPPPPPELDLSKAAKPDADLASVIPIFEPNVDVGEGPNAGSAPSDTQEMPLVRVEPQYPPRAAQRGLEGWVILRFTITTVGTVSNATVVDSSHSIFERAALRAVRKWKYNPRVEDGVAVRRAGVEVMLSFQMDEKQ